MSGRGAFATWRKLRPQLSCPETGNLTEDRAGVGPRGMREAGVVAGIFMCSPPPPPPGTKIHMAPKGWG